MGGEGPAIVRWELAADGEGTVLRLWHRDVSTAAAPDDAAGWHGFLDEVPVHLAGGELGPGWARFEQLQAVYRGAKTG